MSHRTHLALTKAPTLCLAKALLAIAAVPAAACPSPPPAPVTLDLPGYYTDTAKARPDPEREAALRAATHETTRFLRVVTTNADLSRQSPSPRTQRIAARCATKWLLAWAEGRAYTGSMGSSQAEYQRKWDLAGMALATLKLRPHLTDDEFGTLSAWLHRLAEQVVAFQFAPGRTFNNHAYWAALAIAATAHLTHDDALWSRARDIFERAAAGIAADGSLVAELERGERALHYHAFSAMALVTLAELAAARGEDWYATADGALHRLVARTAAGVAEPEQFDRLAGTRQQRPVDARAGWAILYRARFPDRAAGPISVARGHRWLGGDVLVLRAALDTDLSRAPEAQSDVRK
ncbi:MAG: alginate lyase family protein [Hyphomicrobiaceae bacterium]